MESTPPGPPTSMARPSRTCCTGKAALKSPKLCSGSSTGCCGNQVPESIKNTATLKDDCSDQSCCTSATQVEPKRGLCDTAIVTRFGVPDPEKGMNTEEHVILLVEGLTCAGCENKLIRSLEAIHSVRNIQTSLVLSRAEFDVDLSENSVGDVVRYMERATGFSCHIDTNDGQQLDVVVDGDARYFVQQRYPDGVSDMICLGYQIVRITYDSRIVGARDLLEKRFNTALQLAPPQPHPGLAAGNKHVRKTAWITLLSVVLTIPVLVLAWAPSSPQHDILYGSLSLALATVIQAVVAGPFYSSALRSLIFTLVIEMDLLIVLSTTTAYIFSIVCFVYQVQKRPLPTGSFFETSTLLMTLIMLGRLVSAFARQKAVESISIRSLQAPTTLIINPASKVEETIDTRLLQYGDVFKAVPDSRIATDGTILSGSGEVDESMVTGEARLVEKHPGSSVIAGSINGSGMLLVRLTHLPGNNTISDIASMVDEAKFSKPKSQELADRVAGYFVPVIVVLAIITFSIWTAVGIAVTHQVAATAVVQAITYAISVLIVSCPCAVGLAVPMVVVIAGGVASQHGIIFKSASTIETARKVTHVVFDKTGTLTQGQLSVVAETYISESKTLTASIILGLVSNIRHPVSVAIAKYLSSQGVSPAPVEDVTSIAGKGIDATLNGTTIRAGNSHWLEVDTHPLILPLLAKNLTVLCVSRDGALLAAYGLEDTLRPEARTVIEELTRRGIAISLVSGDDAGPVHAVATALGIPPPNVLARCSPARKQAYVTSLLARPRHPPPTKVQPHTPTVLFIGDGTNDAPALAAASIGVHIPPNADIPTDPTANPTASALAHTAADVVLLRPSLTSILTLIDLSRAAYRRIVWNFAWAGVYNIFAILLAAGAFVRVRVEPRWAGVGEIVSVVPVVGVAVGLRLWRR